MDKKSGDFHDIDVSAAMKLAQSDAAKQLFALLQSADPGALQNAMDQAAAGNLTAARDMLSGMMEDDRAKGLLRQIQDGAHG